MILKQNTHHKRSAFVAFDFILVIIEWIKTNQTKHRPTHTQNTQKTKTCVVKIVVIIQNNKKTLCIDEIKTLTLNEPLKK